MKRNADIEALEARIASSVVYFRSMGANGRWYYSVRSNSFSLPGSGVNIKIAIENFLTRNNLEK